MDATEFVPPLLDENGSLLVAECTHDGHRWFPPDRYGCQRCGAYGEDIRLQPTSASGVLVDSVVVHRYRGPGPNAPFAVGSIRLDGSLQMRALVVDGTPAGSRVSGERTEQPDGSVWMIFSEVSA